MGDVISRAAAIEALSTPCDKRYRHSVWETCLDNIETAIRNIPAVDAAPVVHGRWISKSEEGLYGPAYCSICDFELRIDDTPYCPMCGAKMDGERRDSE